MDILEIAHKVALFFIPFLFALCFHEFAHGLVAKWRGDNTAEIMGRLTLNPFAHADLLGTFILPLSAIIFSVPIFFGWAKPVPVQVRNLKNPRVDMFWIALAGPLSNFLLALLGAGILAFLVHLLGMTHTSKAIIEMMSMFIAVNLFLGVFNILPLHPLDGGKILARFLPAEINYKLEQNEHVTSMILFVLVLSGALKFLAYPVGIIHTYLINLSLGSMAGIL